MQPDTTFLYTAEQVAVMFYYSCLTHDERIINNKQATTIPGNWDETSTP